MFVWNFVFIVFIRFLKKIKKVNMHLKDMHFQGMTNPMNKKALNSIQNELNYKSVKRGMSSGNLAKFATLGGCNLAGNWLFQVFFCGFLYARLDSTNQQNLKKIWDMKGKKCAIWRGMAHLYFYRCRLKPYRWEWEIKKLYRRLYTVKFDWPPPDVRMDVLYLEKFLLFILSTLRVWP